MCIQVTSAVWLSYSLKAGGCDSGDRVWWFGLVEAVYTFLAPVVWFAGIAVMACVKCVIDAY